MSDSFLSYLDLEARWKPPGGTAKARRKWVQRRCEAWGVKSLPGGRGDTVRFRPVDVERGEARAAGERRVSA